MKRAIVPLLCVCALVATACRGDDDTANGATTTSSGPAATTSTTGPTATSGAERSADARLAAGMLLRRRDLPGSGWAARPVPDEGAAVASFQRLCRRLAPARTRIEAAEGGELASAEAAFVKDGRSLPLVRSRVYVLGDGTRASRLFALFGSRVYARCVGDAFADPQPHQPGVTYGTATVRPGAVRAGDDSRRFVVTVPTTSQGATFDTHLDIVVVRRGRAVNLMLLADATPVPLPEPTRLAIIRAATRRLQLS